MANIIISPGKYIQGSEELKKISQHMASLGDSFFFIVSPSGLKRVEEPIRESFKGSSSQLVFETFNGECSKNEINRLRESCKAKKCNVIVGVGGGKILDTAKAVAYYEGIPVAIVPTIASTDAPCSALAVIYTDEGVFSEYLVLPKNPDVVLVDTSIIAKAPARLLVAGMGDALATYFEARAAGRSNANNMPGGKSTMTAQALAKLCYETLLEDGLKAKLALEQKVATKAVENIIEANTFLSGIGFESGGLAAAHSVHNGFTVLEECHHLYHGEKVAFGTITQLVLENSSLEEIERIIRFCKSVGLPTTLAEMGIKEIKEEDIMNVAKATCAEGETIYNMPFEITVEGVYAAILGADALGREIK
ncbi:MAG: glycerol dehydrogenase [Thermotaleaceae bacterium]